MIQTRHGEATLLVVAESEQGQVEVVLEIELLRGTGYKETIKRRSD